MLEAQGEPDQQNRMHQTNASSANISRYRAAEKLHLAGSEHSLSSFLQGHTGAKRNGRSCRSVALFELSISAILQKLNAAHFKAKAEPNLHDVY